MPVKVGQPMENAAAVVASDDAWSEQTITWDTKPPSSQTIATWSVAGPLPIEFDVTQQVRGALVGDKRLALRIFAPTRKRGSAYVQYGSREGDPHLRPQLLITPAADVQVRRIPASPGPSTLTRSVSERHLLSFSLGSSAADAFVPLFGVGIRMTAPRKEN